VVASTVRYYKRRPPASPRLRLWRRSTSSSP